MPDRSQSVARMLSTLEERAKELNCIYRVEEILHRDGTPLETMLRQVAEALPPGWQYPGSCLPRIRFHDLDIHPDDFVETSWVLSSAIEIQGEPVGTVSVYYTQAFPTADEGPFLKEERQLLDTIAGRIAQTLLHRELEEVLERARDGVPREDWLIVLDVLKRTDQRLYHRIARKMLNRMARIGIAEAGGLLVRVMGSRGDDAPETGDENRPVRVQAPQDLDRIAEQTFAMASEHLGEHELLELLQLWLQEDRVHFLILALESSHTSVAEIAAAVERFQHTGVAPEDLSEALHMGLKVSLVRRLLTDNLEFIDSCRRNVDLHDFFQLMDRVIQLPQSHGRLGGKSSGLFLATQVLRRARDRHPSLRDIRVPRTWYLPSDGILQFIAHNDLDDVYNWKYLDLDQVRQEYPNLLQLFKSSRFPAEFAQGLSRALDDLADRPLIVRSSSLLEDRAGAAFSGKYKSLFLANQGSKSERLSAVLDAVAEVYASVFGPDPIQYRAERGLLDHHEEMAIMIQEVVGRRVGRYYMPAWAGVAFSHNELRWSPRIRPEDGLLRLVPGLGTRAVDRLSDDYPVLVAPGQPGLRVNVSPEDVLRYSPRRVDAIDLQANAFGTVDARRLLAEVGGDFPALQQIASVSEGGRIRPLRAIDDADPERMLFTFDGLLADGAFIERMRALLDVLGEALRAPVDLEFAFDGEAFSLLQCRTQSQAPDVAPAPIPRDFPSSSVLFSAHRHVSNGTVANITHIVYVDPDAYGDLPDPERMRDVGRVVSRLNELLPKRQFILMGPGRWGSRGDIRLGVSVTYSDLNNTAALIEIARRRGQYVPDLSFGTHFFQDLVESSIRYLPLYPDDDGAVFNEAFFRSTENMLPTLLPEFASMAGVVRVIDVPEATGGKVAKILMNADLSEALGVLVEPGPGEVASRPAPRPAARPAEDHSRWRLAMARTIARELDPERFGVRAMYVYGSTKNMTAGPGSDIDLLVHFVGSADQRRELELWLEGWSLSLAQFNYLRTGYASEGLLDVRLLTDDDIAKRTSYAVKIGAVTDAARPLPLRGAS